MKRSFPSPGPGPLVAGRRGSAAAGFSLPELILGSLLAALLGAVLLALLLVVQRALVPQRVLSARGTVAQAPCFEVLPAALALHEAFRQQLARASAVYVLGGVVSQAGAAWSPARALSRRTLPDLGVLAHGLSGDSAAFARAYAEMLGPVDLQAGAEDFTVVVVGRGTERPGVLCLVQCRSQSVQEEGSGDWLLREVRLWLSDASELSYSFVERPGSGLFCGAVHSVYRASTDAESIEEGPATLVFPDPWLFAVSQEGDSTRQPGSRFSYFIPVHP